MDRSPTDADPPLPRLWPVDRLTAAFFTLVAAATVVGFARVEHAARFLVVDAGVLASLALVWGFTPRMSPRAAAAWRLVHGCVATPLVFTQVGYLVKGLRRAEYGPALERLDRALCGGVNPLEALEGIARPWLTEVMQWAYTAYLLLPPALVILLLVRGRPAETSRSCFGLLGVMYWSYVGYFLVPASGPNLHNNFGPPLSVAESYPYPLRPDLYTFQDPLPGVWLTTELREAMFLLEPTKQDCFPSGHVAVAATCWILARRLRPAYGGWFFVPAAGVAASTVYLRYHYVADVVGGLLLAWFATGVWARVHDRLLARAAPGPRGG